MSILCNAMTTTVARQCSLFLLMKLNACSTVALGRHIFAVSDIYDNCADSRYRRISFGNYLIVD